MPQLFLQHILVTLIFAWTPGHCAISYKGGNKRSKGHQSLLVNLCYNKIYVLKCDQWGVKSRDQMLQRSNASLRPKHYKYRTTEFNSSGSNDTRKESK